MTRDDSNNIANEFTKEVRKQVTQQAAKWTLAAVSGLIILAAAGWWLVLEREVQAYIQKAAGVEGIASVPTGAVISFTKECNTIPGNWSLYKEAYGRTIVGAIPNGRFKPDEMSHEVKDFRDYFAGIKLGEERVKLIVDEMPAHSHSLGITGLNDVTPTSYKKATMNVPTYTSGPGNPEEGLENNQGKLKIMKEAGGDGAHNNMQPYIALYFCKKD